MTIEWLHESRSDDGLRFRIGRHGERRIAEWDGLVRLEVGADGKASIDAAERSLAVSKLLHGAVPALLGHLTGELHWHAAACVWPNTAAVLVLGAAGAGKSTLVTALCNDTDAAFLADDVALLEPVQAGWDVVRREENHALRPDMAETLFGHRGAAKTVFEPTRSRGRARLGLVLALRAGDEFALRELSAREKIHVLTQNLVRFALDDPQRLKRDLDVVLRLGAEVPMYALVRPRLFSEWTALAGLLTRRLRGVLGNE